MATLVEANIVLVARVPTEVEDVPVAARPSASAGDPKNRQKSSLFMQGPVGIS